MGLFVPVALVILRGCEVQRGDVRAQGHITGQSRGRVGGARGQMSLEGMAVSVPSRRLVSEGICQSCWLRAAARLYGHGHFYALYAGTTHSRI